MFVDSHCHLNYASFKEKGVSHTPAELVARAAQAGVDLMQTICTHPEEFPEILAIAEAHENVVCSFGVHPHDAGEHTVTQTQIVEALAHPKVVGIGETGLDYYYDNAPRAKQRNSFELHLETAAELGVPVIIHTRDADADMMAILKNALAQKNPPKLLFHCFTASDKLADFGLDNGISFSASGIITFKNAQDLRNTFSRVPLEKLLIETDAPFLAPVPNRGKTNEPAFISHTAACLAEIKGISVEELAHITTENFYTLFTKAQAHRPQGQGAA